MNEPIWITVNALRAFYVDRGHDVVVCDRGHSGPVTLILLVSQDELSAFTGGAAAFTSAKGENNA